MGGNNMGGGRRQNVPLRLQTMDSSGPTGKLRGNAYQLHEKYLGLARDAHSSGDRVAAENYFQHAEHYYRIINASGGQTSRHDFDAFENHDGEQPEIPQNYQPNGGQPQPYNQPYNQPNAPMHGQPQPQPQTHGQPHGQPQYHGNNHGQGGQGNGPAHGPGPNGGQPSGGNQPQPSGNPNDRNDRQPY